SSTGILRWPLRQSRLTRSGRQSLSFARNLAQCFIRRAQRLVDIFVEVGSGEEPGAAAGNTHAALQQGSQKPRKPLRVRCAIATIIRDGGSFGESSMENRAKA